MDCGGRFYFPETVNAKGNGGFANIVDNGGFGGIRVGGFGKYNLSGNIDNAITRPLRLALALPTS